MGTFQVCDALINLFKLEISSIKYLEGFILLLRKGDKSHNFFRTLNRKFHLKNSNEFPHWISKNYCIDGGRNVCSRVNELLMRNVY